jgi:hypothetical protein
MISPWIKYAAGVSIEICGVGILDGGDALGGVVREMIRALWTLRLSWKESNGKYRRLREATQVEANQGFRKKHILYIVDMTHYLSK